MHNQHAPPILLHLTEPPLTPTSKKTPSASKLFSSIQRQLQSNRQLIYLKNNKNIYDKIQQALERKLLNNRNQKGMSVKQQFDVKEMILICKQRKHCRGLEGMEGDKDGKREVKREGLGGSGIKDKRKFGQNLLGSKVDNFNQPLYTDRNHKRSTQQTQINVENNKKIKMRPKTGVTRCNTQTTRISSVAGEGKQLFASTIVDKKMNNRTNKKLRKQSKKISDNYTSTTNFFNTFRHEKENIGPTKSHRKMLTSPSCFSTSPHPPQISFRKPHIPSNLPLSTYNPNFNSSHPSSHQPHLIKHRPQSPKQMLTNRFSEIISSCQSEQSDMQYIGQKIGYFQYFWKKVDHQRSTMNDFCKLVDKIKVDIDAEDYE